MADSINDRDLELIAKSGVPIPAIIDNINNGINTFIGSDEFVEVDGEYAVFHMHSRKIRIKQDYAIPALLEFEKTASCIRSESEIAKMNFKKQRLFNGSPQEFSDMIGMMRDGYKSYPEHRNAEELFKNNDVSHSFESQPNNTEAPLQSESPGHDIEVARKPNINLRYNPIFYCLIFLLIVWFSPIVVLYPLFAPMAIIQVVVIVGSFFIYIRKSPSDTGTHKPPRNINWRLSPRQALFVVPVLLPLLVVAMSYSIMMHKIARELDENGAIAMATISKVDQHEISNNRIDRIRMDFSFQARNGRIFEASRHFPGSNSQHLKCLNNSLIKVKYSPDNPEIFEVVLPCLGGSP